MSRSAHTPGPWFVFDNGHCVGGPFTPGPDDNPNHIAAGVAMCGMRLRKPEEVAANARLIAAAPSLLEACERVAEFLAMIRPIRAAMGGGDSPWLSSLEAAVLPAIEKAKGGAA